MLGSLMLMKTACRNIFVVSGWGGLSEPSLLVVINIKGTPKVSIESDAAGINEPIVAEAFDIPQGSLTGKENGGKNGGDETIVPSHAAALFKSMLVCPQYRRSEE